MDETSVEGADRPAEAAPRGIKGYVRARASGKLGGYAFDRSHPDKVLVLEFYLGERLVASRTCNTKSPLSAPPDAPQCGFTIAPWDYKGAWFDQPLTVRVAGTKRAISKQPFPLREQVQLVSLARAPGRLTATIAAPAPLHPLLHPVMAIDGERVVPFRATGASGLLHLHAPLAVDDLADHEVTLSWRDGEPLAGSPMVAEVRAAPVTANPRFEAWSGDRPSGWEIETTGAVLLRPAGAAASAASGLAIDLGSEGGALRLSQAVLPGGDRPREIEVVARASAPATVRLIAGDAGGENLALVPEWTTARRSVAADATALSLDVAGSGATVELAVLALGGEGFAAEAAGVDPVADAVGAAIANADFSDWPHGLVFAATARHQETARGWFLACKPAMPAVRAGLATIEQRDLVTGDGGALRYALALSGVASGAWLRLEASLSKAALAAGRVDRLAMTLGTRSGRPSRGAIGKIFVFERTIDGEEAKPSFETVCQLTGPVPVPVVSKRLDWTLPASRTGALRLAAELALADPRKEFFLAVEFYPQSLDVLISDVELGTVAVAERAARAAEDSGYLALEDAAIRRQLGRLRGLEGWTSTEPARPRAAAAAPAAQPWTWRGFAPVDVVVPVYNAVDDVLACVRALERATAMPHRVILVNDASDLATRTELEAFAASRPWIELVTNAVNRGYTRTANIGLSRSMAEWVVLLNSDTIVSAGWLVGLLDCARSDPAIAAVGPLSNAASYQSVPALRDRRQRWMVNALPLGFDVDAMAALVRDQSARAYPRVPLLNGFCTLFRRTVLEQVGFLDEIAFPIGYGEENDLCLRIGEAGHVLAVADDVYVYHSKSASFGDARRTELSRAGTAACLAKHPGVDLKEVEQQLIECVPLIELRRRVAAALAARGIAPVAENGAGDELAA